VQLFWDNTGERRVQIDPNIMNVGATCCVNGYWTGISREQFVLWTPDVPQIEIGERYKVMSIRRAFTSFPNL